MVVLLGYDHGTLPRNLSHQAVSPLPPAHAVTPIQQRFCLDVVLAVTQATIVLHVAPDTSGVSVE